MNAISSNNIASALVGQRLDTSSGKRLEASAKQPAESFAKHLETGPKAKADRPQFEEAFGQFVGETVFGQALASMRKTVKPAPYFNGGRGEEVFRQQLDQEIVKNMASGKNERLVTPMLELFNLQRR